MFYYNAWANGPMVFEWKKKHFVPKSGPVVCNNYYQENTHVTPYIV